MFLRKHMDAQGWVFLNVLQNFNRIKQLTLDVELLRWTCLRSPSIDFQTGSDGLDRVRRAQGWEQWVLLKEERDPSAQHDGPLQLHSPILPYPETMAMSQMGMRDQYQGPQGYQYRPEQPEINGHACGPNGYS